MGREYPEGCNCGSQIDRIRVRIIIEQRGRGMSENNGASCAYWNLCEETHRFVEVEV